MTAWRVLCGWLVFVAVSTIAGAGLATLSGKLGVPTAWMALSAGALAGVWLARRTSEAPRRVSAAELILFAIFAVASLRAFLWLIYLDGPDLKVLSPNNLGDMALHLNLIQRWANGGAFWPENPFLTGAPFAYHPGMDLWNALLRLTGVPLYAGLRWTALLGAAAAAVALWRWGGAFALAAFLFAGGLGALEILTKGSSDLMQGDIAWKNPFLAILVTQRGLLYSLPAGLVLMTSWRTRLRGDENGPQLPLLAEAALYASMPLFNAPAFIFLSALLAACVVAAWREGRARGFILTGVVSLIPASWLVSMVTARFTAPSALRWAPGWMQEDAGVHFWLWNFGIFLPLVAVLVLVLLRRGKTDARVFGFVGTGMLLFCFLFALAPWPWDNTKLIIWGYLAVVPFLWEDLLARWPRWARAATCLILFASGAMALAAGLDSRHGYGLANRTELAEVQVALRRIGADARVICCPGYSHPLMLLGQPLAMGYDGHLFSQGLDYGPAQRDIDEVMSGGANWQQAARRLRSPYLFWGKREEERWPNSTQPWKSCAPPVASSATWKLYNLIPCLIGDETPALASGKPEYTFSHCIDISSKNFTEKDYDFWVVAFNDTDGQTIFRQDANSDEIKGLLKDRSGRCKIWRKFQTTKKPESWIVWPHSKSKGWCKSVTGTL